MEKKLKQQLLLVCVGVALFAGLMNLNVVVGFLEKLASLVRPVLMGFIFAFILNVPMRGFERLLTRLLSRARHAPGEKGIGRLSLALTLLCLLLIIVLLCTLLIPELVSSVTSLYQLVAERWPEWAAKLQEYDIDASVVNDYLDSLDIDKLVEQLKDGAGSLLSSAVGIVSSTVSGLVSAGMALIIAVYVLLCKRELSRGARRLLKAYLRDGVSLRIIHLARLVQDIFTRFLSGQFVEACILGTLIALAMLLFGIPYAALIGILTAVLAFVPYVGAITACIIGALLVLLAEPSKTLVCIIVYQAVQFIENQFIYPRVVGKSVDLPPLWTLVAVVIGGKLMGLFGMIFFIPLMAVVFALIREGTERRLVRREAGDRHRSEADEEPPPPSED